MELSTCGLICSDCEFYRKSCPGCRAVRGRPFWAEEVEGKSCFLYDCCTEKGFHSCGNCSELPCKSFVELKDPNVSDEAHQLELARRVERLN